MPPISAVTAANTLIERFGRDGDIDHLKLQKLLYYAYGWWLALCQNDEPLLDARPQVWKLGPVFRPVYAAFAGFRDAPIRTPQKPAPFMQIKTLEQDETAPSQMLDWIWQRYGHYTGWELSDMTHAPGTPWYTIAKEHNFRVPKFLPMSDDENRSYFTELAKSEGIIQLAAR